MLTQESVTEALKAVKFPGYSRDIVSFGMVKDIACGDGAVEVTRLQVAGRQAMDAKAFLTGHAVPTGTRFV